MTPPNDKAPAPARAENLTPADTAKTDASSLMVQDAYGENKLTVKALKPSRGQSTASLHMPDLQLVNGDKVAMPSVRLEQKLQVDLSVGNRHNPVEAETAVQQSTKQNSMDELVRLALAGNTQSEEIVRRISNADFGAKRRAKDDVVFAAVRQLTEKPEYKEQLRNAAMRGYLKHDDDEVLKAIGEIAVKDKNMERVLKEYAYTGLRSDSEDRRASAATLLNAISRTWNSGDAKVAAAQVTPENLQSFKSALSGATEEVRVQVMHDMLKSIGNGPLETREQKLFALLLTKPSNDGLYANPRGKTSVFPSDFNPLDELNKEQNAFPPLHTQDSSRDLQKELYPNRDRSPYDGSKHFEDGKYDTRYLGATFGTPLRMEKAEKGSTVLENWNVPNETTEEKVRIQDVLKRYDHQALRFVDSRIALYNSLAPEMRKELTGQDEQLDARQVFGKLANESSDNKTAADLAFLLNPKPPAKSLEEKLADKISDQQRGVSAATNRLNKLTEERNQDFIGLTNHAEHGVGFVNRLDQIVTKLEIVTNPLGALTSPNFIIDDHGSISMKKLGFREDGVDRWSKEQSAHVREYIESNQDARKALIDLSRSVIEMNRLELSRDAFQHSELSNAGSKDLADLLAINMLEKYGLDAIKQAARPIYDQLTQNHGILERMHADGITKSTIVMEHDPKSDLGLKESLQDLTQLKFDQTMGNVELDALRKNALQSLDQDATLNKMSGIAGTFNTELSQLNKMFNAGMEGSKFDDYIDLVRNTAKPLEEAMNSITAADIKDLKSKITEIAAAAEKCQDARSTQELLNRKEAMTAMLAVVDPTSEQHKKLQKMFDDIKSRDFRADTFGNWVKENGPVIGATLIASGLTAASMGAASPLLALVVSSAMAYGASQTTKELLYLSNHYITDSGLGVLSERSNAGEWAVKSFHRWEGVADAFSNDGVQQGFIALTAAQKQITEDYVTDVLGPSASEISKDVVLSLATVGIVKFANGGFKGFSKEGLRAFATSPEAAQLAKQVDRAAAIASKDPAAKQLVGGWFSTLKESGTHAAKEVGETAFQEGSSNLAEDALKDLKMQNSVSGFIVSAALAVAQSKFGKGHAHHEPLQVSHFSDGDKVNFHPELKADILQRLRQDGHTVIDRGNGLFDVSPFNAEQGMKPIKVRFDNDHQQSVKLTRESERQAFIEHHQRMAAKLDDVPEREIGRQRDLYRGQPPEITDAMVARFKAEIPELSGAAVADFEQRMAAAQTTWTEDLSKGYEQQRKLAYESDQAYERWNDASQQVRERLTGEISPQVNADPQWKDKSSAEKSAETARRVQQEYLSLDNDPSTPSGKAYKEMVVKNSETSQNQKRLAEQASVRAKQIESELNAFCKEHNLPELKVTPEDLGGGISAMYAFGRGEISLPSHSVLESNATGNLSKDIFHELVHAAQDRKVAEYALHKANNNLAEAQKIYSELTGITPDLVEGQQYSSLIKNTADATKDKQWDTRMDQRAQDLAKSIKETVGVGYESLNVAAREKFLEGRYHSITRNTHGNAVTHVFEHMSSPEHGARYTREVFPSGVPADVKMALEHWQETRNNPSHFKSEEARAVVEKAIEREFKAAQELHKSLDQKYKNSMIEQEAFTGESSKHYDTASEANQRHAKPSESDVQQGVAMLDAASKQKHDSLNPLVKNSAQVREMYEQKLRDGSMTNQQLEKLLKVEDTYHRDQIEKLLVDNKINAAGVDKILQVNLNELFETKGSDVLISALQEGTVSTEGLNRFFALKDSKAGLDFNNLSPQSVEKFFKLGEQDMRALANATKPGQTQTRIGVPELEALLSGPNNVAGLVHQLRTGTLTIAQVRTIGNFAPTDAVAISNMLSKGVMTKENAPSMLKAIENGQIRTADLKALGDASLHQYVGPDDAQKILALDPASRNTVNEFIANEINAKRRHSEVKVGEVVNKVQQLESFRKQGMLRESDVTAMAVSPASTDPAFTVILQQQSKLSADKRVSSDTLHQLFELGRNGEISYAAMEGYRLALTELDAGTINRMVGDSKSAREVYHQILANKSEAVSTLFEHDNAKLPESQRIDNECMQMVLDRFRDGEIDLETVDRYRKALMEGAITNKDVEATYPDKTNAQSALDRRVRSHASNEPSALQVLTDAQNNGTAKSVAAKITSVASKVFPDMFPEGGKFDMKPADIHPNDSHAMQDIKTFAGKMAEGDFLEAIKSAENGKSTSSSLVYQWQPQLLEITELNNQAALRNLHKRMLAADCKEDANHEIRDRVIYMVDPTIKLQDGRQFKLRDSDHMIENGKSRLATKQERDMITQIQNTPTGKAIIGKTAMIIYEEKLVHSNQSGAMVSKLTNDFSNSPEYKELRHHHNESTNDINEAMREIDAAASMLDAGMTMDGVKKLFGDQHLSGERDFFYKWMEKRALQNKHTSIDVMGAKRSQMGSLASQLEFIARGGEAVA